MGAAIALPISVRDRVPATAPASPATTATRPKRTITALVFFQMLLGIIRREGVPGGNLNQHWTYRKCSTASAVPRTILRQISAAAGNICSHFTTSRSKKYQSAAALNHCAVTDCSMLAQIDAIAANLLQKCAGNPVRQVYHGVVHKWSQLDSRPR